MCHKFTIYRTWTLRYTFFLIRTIILSFVPPYELWFFTSNSFQILLNVYSWSSENLFFHVVISAIYTLSCSILKMQMINFYTVYVWRAISFLHWSTRGKNLNVVKCWRDMICHWMVMNGYVFTWNCQLYTT